jgi:hypothetical protein
MKNLPDWGKTVSILVQGSTYLRALERIMDHDLTANVSTSSA